MSDKKLQNCTMWIIVREIPNKRKDIDAQKDDLILPSKHTIILIVNCKLSLNRIGQWILRKFDSICIWSSVIDLIFNVMPCCDTTKMHLPALSYTRTQTHSHTWAMMQLSNVAVHTPPTQFTWAGRPDLWRAHCAEINTPFGFATTEESNNYRFPYHLSI